MIVFYQFTGGFSCRSTCLIIFLCEAESRFQKQPSWVRLSLLRSTKFSCAVQDKNTQLLSCSMSHTNSDDHYAHLCRSYVSQASRKILTTIFPAKPRYSPVCLGQEKSA